VVVLVEAEDLEKELVGTVSAGGKKTKR